MSKERWIARDNLAYPMLGSSAMPSQAFVFRHRPVRKAPVKMAERGINGGLVVTTVVRDPTPYDGVEHPCQVVDPFVRSGSAARPGRIGIGADGVDQHHARGLVKSMGTRLPRCSSPSFAEKVKDAIPLEVREALLPLVQLVKTVNECIERYDQKIEELGRKKYGHTTLLRQVKGVGPITSLAYVLTLEDPQRFASSREVGPYLGLVPKQEDSGDSQPQLGISKAGDRMLRRLLVGSSQYILGAFGPDSDLRQYGLRLCERGGKNAKKRAVVAVARKLAVETFCTTAAELVEDLSNASKKGHLQESLSTYTHPHVLVIDEVGYLTYGQDAANVLFHVVNDRHLRKRPMIFTTNKPLSEWGKVLHDEDLAAAILDRVLERGRFIHLDGPSGRTRHLNLEEVLPEKSERVRISGINGSEFPEPTAGTELNRRRQPFQSVAILNIQQLAGPGRLRKLVKLRASRLYCGLNCGLRFVPISSPKPLLFRDRSQQLTSTVSILRSVT